MSNNLENKATKITNLFKMLQSRKSLLLYIINYKLNTLVIKLQSVYKGFLFRKNLKQNLLVNQLLYQRHSMAKRIQQYF